MVTKHNIDVGSFLAFSGYLKLNLPIIIIQQYWYFYTLLIVLKYIFKCTKFFKWFEKCLKNNDTHFACFKKYSIFIYKYQYNYFYNMPLYVVIYFREHI